MSVSVPGVLPPSFSRVLIWDAPTRVCHWLFMGCFAGAYWTADQDEWESVHAALGYTAGGLVLFRIFWGFWGTRYARFAGSLQGPTSVARYLAQMPHGWSKRYAGHSPASAMVLLFFLAIALVLCVSGWAQTASTPHVVSLAEIHGAASSTMLVFIGLHIAALLFSSWRSGENLLLSLLTGTKSGAPGEAIPSARQGVAWLLLVAVLAFWLLQWSSASKPAHTTPKAMPVAQQTPHLEAVAPSVNPMYAHPAC